MVPSLTVALISSLMLIREQAVVSYTAALKHISYSPGWFPCIFRPPPLFFLDHPWLLTGVIGMPPLPQKSQNNHLTGLTTLTHAHALPPHPAAHNHNTRRVGLIQTHWLHLLFYFKKESTFYLILAAHRHCAKNHPPTSGFRGELVMWPDYVTSMDHPQMEWLCKQCGPMLCMYYS